MESEEGSGSPSNSRIRSIRLPICNLHLGEARARYRVEVEPLGPRLSEAEFGCRPSMVSLLPSLGLRPPNADKPARPFLRTDPAG
jgi:hypothetical protein